MEIRRKRLLSSVVGVVAVGFLAACSGSAAATEVSAYPAVASSEDIPQRIPYSLRRTVQVIREQDYFSVTPLQLEVLADYWVTDVELEQIRQASEACRAQFVPVDMPYVPADQPGGGDWYFLRMYVPETEAQSDALAAANAACNDASFAIWSYHQQSRQRLEYDPRMTQLLECMVAQGVPDAEQMSQLDLDDVWDLQQWWESRPAAWECRLELSTIISD